MLKMFSCLSSYRIWLRVVNTHLLQFACLYRQQQQKKVMKILITTDGWRFVLLLYELLQMKKLH